MTAVEEHYDALLADVYSWTYGDAETVYARNLEFFNTHGISPQSTKAAVDLGAGSGFQSIPLARLGFSVTAIDTSPKLLRELKEQAGNLEIKTVVDDLLNFQKHCAVKPELIVCMGDTLTHLSPFAKVTELINKAADALEEKGLLVLSLRDYVSNELRGTARFIPVRKDENRIFTCFLEYQPEIVMVHDILYSRNGSAEWKFSTSAYPKLRISPNWLKEQLESAKFNIVHNSSVSGMMYFIARKSD